MNEHEQFIGRIRGEVELDAGMFERPTDYGQETLGEHGVRLAQAVVRLCGLLDNWAYAAQPMSETDRHLREVSAVLLPLLAENDRG